jgi:hypothetical protein
MQELPKTSKGLADRWKTLEGKKTSVISRSEDYALWTLPYVFPPTSTKESELQGPLDSIGARAVNHLSNKLVMTLFQPSQPFFRLRVTDDMLDEIKQAAEEGDSDASTMIAEIDKVLAKKERAAMSELNFSSFRTAATNSTKALIVTGNCLEYHPENSKKVQTYSLRDYCVVRDLSGTVIEFMTRDSKAFSTFSDEIQAKLTTDRNHKYNAESDVVLYTHVKLGVDGRYHMKQAADNTMLDSEGSWPAEELPWIILTWNLVRGEDYGRGLVEDYAGAFHSLYILAQAEVDVIGIASDIKFLVNPASTIDIVELNKSESGSYHSGREGDVVALQLNKAVDMQMVEAMVERLQRQIAAAFLLNSGVTRDAERVTAEEIRATANELEMSHGGVYSRFAEDWQYRVAVLMLKRVGLDTGDGQTLAPHIITGLDSLSRAGDLDNLRMFIADLSLLENVPDELRGAIDPAKFIGFIGVRRGVDYEQFIKSSEQMQQEQAQQMQMQQQQMQMQAGANVAEEAGKAAVNQTGE